MPSEEDTFAAAKARRESEKPTVTARAAPSLPFDPVLRLALIDKGVITPEDLTTAEKKIVTLGGGSGG